MSKQKLSEQLNFRVVPDVYARIKRLAERERRAPGEVARMIVEAVLAEAERSASLADFEVHPADAPRLFYSKRFSEETQEHAFAGLRIVFDLADSELVERIVREIGRVASDAQLHRTAQTERAVSRKPDARKKQA